MSENEPTGLFTDFPFRDSIQKDIRAAGFETPTPIQAQCIPPVMEGRDVIGLAQTGTGKTAAFALPIIQRVARREHMAALVLSPTRELAQQIAAMFNQLGKSSGIHVATIVGGIPIKEDYKALQSWPNVLVATPGRLIDHIMSRTIVLDDIEVLVIDEADRMHDMGFIPQIRDIIQAIPQDRQTLMFSATMPADVEQIARKQMRDPVRVQIGLRTALAERAVQKLYLLHEDDKTPMLLNLLRETEGSALIFLKTKRKVDRVAREVSRRHFNVTRLHSGRSQADRDRAMAGFREGRYRIMIATDVAARGLDVADIAHVINYDFPHAPEDYVHRVGRTARAEMAGRASSFVTRADQRCVARLEKLLGHKLPTDQTPEEAIKPERKKARRRSSGKRRRAKARARDAQSSPPGEATP